METFLAELSPPLWEVGPVLWPIRSHSKTVVETSARNINGKEARMESMYVGAETHLLFQICSNSIEI